MVNLARSHKLTIALLGYGLLGRVVLTAVIVALFDSPVFGQSYVLLTISKTDIGMMRLIENIVIVNTDIETNGSMSNWLKCNGVFKSYRFIGHDRDCFSDDRVPSNNPLSVAASFSNNLDGTNLNDIVQHHGFTKVFYTETPAVSRSKTSFNANTFNSNVGSQFIFGGFLSRRPQVTSKNGQHEGNNSENSRDINKPPFRRRIIASLFMFFGGFWIYAKGWYYFYEQRKGLGTALIYGGIFMLLSGVGLWLMTGFRWSWGWYL